MASGPEGRREESVQFSLKELLELEDQRLAEQARERDAREVAAARERAEAERRRREEAEAHARAEEEARERQRRTELEELARREAMQKGIVEQARLEVEVRARAEERERERRHEIEIERLRSTAKKGGSLGALIGASAIGGSVMAIVALAIHLGVHAPAAERRVAELQRSMTAAEARADELARQLDGQRRAVSERDRQLADAQEQIRALTAQKSAPASGTGSKLGLGAPGPKAPVVRPSNKEEKECLPGDPMCFSLKTGR